MVSTAAPKKPGDRIATEKRGRVGPRTRSGTIKEVFGTAEREHYLVRWDDGTTSMYYPTHVDRPAPERSPTRAASPASVPVSEPLKPPWPNLTAQRGDRLVVHSHYLGQPGRDAEILEVRGANGRAPFLVRWADTGQVTLVYPGNDATVDHIAKRRRQRRAN
jgi:hypothetical protein